MKKSAARYTQLKEEWHPKKNKGRKLSDFSKGSSFRAWWRCRRGHEWQTRVSHRVGGSSCPRCPSPVAKEKQLVRRYPSIAREWHPTRNELEIEFVSVGSSKKFWWRCPVGHVWEASADERVRGGKKCPRCLHLAPRDKRFSLLHTKAAREWHPRRNGRLRPKHFAESSKHKAWWRCPKGHVWQETVASRSRGATCPSCPRLAPEKRRLSLLYPEVAYEWHATKNGDLLPEHFSYGSSEKVWWECSLGHEWEASINRRVQGSDCPKCAGREASDDYNLEVCHPEIADEWHPTKNGDLLPEDFLPGSNRRVWWQCDRGHEWETKISTRSVKDKRRKKLPGCPECNGTRVGKDNNLLAVYPGIAREWHPTKNGDLLPEDFLPGSNRRVWWQCDQGHEWETGIVTRCKKDKRRKKLPGCPECSGRKVGKDNNLAKRLPALAREWHKTRNGGLTAREVTPGSSLKVWWQCARGHEWEAQIHSRSCGNGCPYCANALVSDDNNLLLVNPKLACEWHKTRNGKLTPEKVIPGSERKVWWQCARGHEWEARISSRHYGHGCSECSGQKLGRDNNLLVLSPQLSREWHPQKNGSLTPEKILAGSIKKVWWQCDLGHEWQAQVGVRYHRQTGCPYCNTGGFRDFLPGYLYLLRSEKYGCWQIGITNRIDTRLQQHQRHGDFQVVEILRFKEGLRAREIEREILSDWKKRGFAPALGPREMPQSGWSETVSFTDLKKFDLKRWRSEVRTGGG